MQPDGLLSCGMWRHYVHGLCHHGVYRGYALCSLFNGAVSLCSAECLNLRHSPGICLETLRKGTKELCEARRWHDRLSSLAPPKRKEQASVEANWNVMAHAQKPDFVFRRNGRVHLNRRGRQFSRLLAAEVCASTLVMLDTPRSEVVWVLATHSIRQFPLHFPSHASPCAITFQLESAYQSTRRPVLETSNLYSLRRDDVTLLSCFFPLCRYRSVDGHLIGVCRSFPQSFQGSACIVSQIDLWPLVISCKSPCTSNTLLTESTTPTTTFILEWCLPVHSPQFRHLDSWGSVVKKAERTVGHTPVAEVCEEACCALLLYRSCSCCVFTAHSW